MKTWKLLLALPFIFISCCSPSEEERAIHTLLKLKQASITHMSVPDSIQIAESIDYFWQNSRLDLLTDTYYYMGCISLNKRDYERSLYQLKYAEQYSKKLHCRDKEIQVQKKLRDFGKKYRMDLNADAQKIIYAKVAIFNLQTEYETKTRFLYNVGLSLLFVFTILASFFYSKNRRNRRMVKFALLQNLEMKNEMEERIHSMKVSKQMGLITLEKQKKTFLRQQMEKLALGKKLYCEIEDGGTTATWDKRNFEEYNEYYKLIDSSFLMSLENEFYALTPQNVFYEILCHKQIPEEEILRILCKTNGALRTMKSRIKQRRR